MWACADHRKFYQQNTPDVFSAGLTVALGRASRRALRLFSATFAIQASAFAEKAHQDLTTGDREEYPQSAPRWQVDTAIF